MIVMILAAGVGTRLSPLTLYMPKPMVPICNKPIMEHIIDLLAQHNLKTVVASLHYQPDQIERYFGNGQRWGVNLTYSLERDLLGTAGAVKRVADIFEDTLCVIKGDALTDLDLTAMLEFHRQKKAGMTIALHKIDEPARYEVVQTNEQGKILRFQENPRSGEELSNLVDMGIYFIEPEILNLIPVESKFDINSQLFPLLLEKEIPFYGYHSECYWSEIESFNEFRNAQAAMLNGRIKTASIPGRQVTREHWQGRNVSIHPKATINPPVLVGDNCQIEENAVIGPNTVIGNNVIVAENATVTESTILGGTYVGRLVFVKDAVVNRNCLINVPSNTSVFVADNFLLGEVGEDVVLRGSVRAIELAVTLFLLILSIPLWVIATILALFAGKGDIIEKKLRTTNHPGVLFEGGRIGWREVSIPRFRADPTTTAGRWLERTGLRHLPELISVIKGDLALVGTGPLTAEQVSLLNDDWHHQRFQAQAGLTGLWYLNRLNYPDISMTLEEQLIDDSYYAVTRNWKEDVKIFFRSFGVWFKLLFKPGR